MAQAARAARTPQVPPDEEGAGHSGRLLLRMPQSLHGELARAAEQEGVSLNTYITGVLSGALRWRAPGGEQPRPGGRLLRAAIVADVVLVAVAAIVATALLIVAWA